MNNKKDGRIGDTPLIACGTWADNETCGVSGTGDGEVKEIQFWKLSILSINFLPH